MHASRKLRKDVHDAQGQGEVVVDVAQPLSCLTSRSAAGADGLAQVDAVNTRFGDSARTTQPSDELHAECTET